MEHLLKEALKTLCGVNQWSYAVYWKIGCQNPKLLIWEECYYEQSSFSGLAGTSENRNPENAFEDCNATSVSSQSSNVRPHFPAADNVNLLLNKMMMDNDVHIVGEGLVGRAAFTGKHLWILSGNFHKETHPPKVIEEVYQQFSSGIKTVVIIPVLPHGVVQFGSHLKIVENMGFVNDVVWLILQLGHITGVFQPKDYTANESAPRVGIPVLHGYSTHGKFPIKSSMANAFIPVSSNFVPEISASFSYGVETKNEVLPASQASNWSLSHHKTRDWYDEAATAEALEMDSSRQNHFMNAVAKAEVITMNSDMWTNQCSLNRQITSKDLSSASSSAWIHCSTVFDGKNILSGSCCEGNISVRENAASPTLCELNNFSSSKTDASFPNSVGYHIYKNSAKGGLDPCKKEMEQSMIHSRDGLVTQIDEHLRSDVLVPGLLEGDLKQISESHGGPGNNFTNYDGRSSHHQSGDDLFDILGSDLKKKLLKSYCNGHVSNGEILPFSELHSASQENSESGIFSATCTDHLLDAVVFKSHTPAKQRVDDNVSCGTNLTNMSSSSTPLCPSVPLGVHDRTKGNVLIIPEYLADARAMSSASLRKEGTAEDSGTYSQCSSIYDSWAKKGPTMEHDNNTSTGFSAKSSKPNRKRLKPGENPRPRPKDRQMIQDRVKELREIVPNGAKCSIDALLERTIKHMLFLQSVSKHADKLKETVQSKIIRNGGDNLGGATWAYEVGSQSMICPIVIENLNQPGHMLIEMLCQGRGLFLEIADTIRGLGLTILKGITETRNDNIWACFAVEANRDLTWMEIFLSLVGLLEQNTAEDTPFVNNISNNNVAAQETHPGSRILSTGEVPHLVNGLNVFETC